jgi:hypothetical protein
VPPPLDSRPPSLFFLKSVYFFLAFFLVTPTMALYSRRLADLEVALRLHQGREEAHNGNGCYFVFI